MRDRARAIVDATLRHFNVTRSRALPALSAGLALARRGGGPTSWAPPASDRGRAAVAVGGALLALVRDVSVMLEPDGSGRPDAVDLVHEALTRKEV
jgi:hypothetical protein